MNIFNFVVNRISTAFHFGSRNRSSSHTNKATFEEIDKSRFESVLSKRGVPAHIIETMFKTLDVNGDGKINGNDFQRILAIHAQRIRNERSTAAQSKPVEDTTPNTSAHQTIKTSVPRSSPVNADMVKEKIAALERQAATYSRDGSPRIYTMNTFVNAQA
jgi:Ca2+-binding EF-hand superfamily protein